MRAKNLRKIAPAFILLVMALLLVLWSRKNTPVEPQHTPGGYVRDLSAKSPWYSHFMANSPLVRKLLPAKWIAREHRTWTEREFRRNQARAELSRMGTNAWAVIPELLAALAGGDPGVRIMAGWTLAEIRAENHPDWSRLAKVLDGKSRAVEALWYILENPSPNQERNHGAHRRFALVGLAATGQAVAQVYSGLVRLVKSGDQAELRALAITALAKSKSERQTSVALLKQVLESADEWPQVRAAAALALADSVSDYPETRRVLEQALQDERALVRSGAAAALWRAGAPPSQVLAIQAALLNHKLPSVRACALQRLAEMGKAAEPMRSKIVPLTADESEAVRNAALEAIRRINGQSTSVVSPGPLVAAWQTF